ncbi:uncharacterized protein LOC111137664 [Crassostrea virginica]
MEEPLDLTTKRVKPEYARSHIQHFSTLPQKKGHYTSPQKKGHYTTPECHTLQTAAEDAADPVGIDMTGARLSPDWGEDHRARYYDINRHSILDFSLGKDASRECRPPSRDSGEEEEGEKDAVPSLHRHNPRDNSQAHTSLEGTTRSVLREGPVREGLYCELEGVRVSVLDSHLWMAFNEIQTEMIINRGGRRMFPYLYISVSGLDPDAVYDVLLDILPADKRRFKFFNESWVPVGVAEPQQDNAPYVHPESPSPGSLWMARKISFARVKLTNSLESSPENVYLHSMHKYVIQITLQKRNQMTAEVEKCARFLLQETNFIAVTAYQNSKITHLKILNNPFAKAFRGDKPRYKRHRRRHQEEKDPKSNNAISPGQEGDDVIDDRRMEEPHLIFPWTRPPIFSHNQEDELSNKRPSVSEVKSDDTGLKKMCLPPYLLSAYRYNAGIYASIVAYHARIAELNSSGATGDGTASASYKN